MSLFQHNQPAGPQHQLEPPAPKRRKPSKLAIAGTALALFLGFTAGTSTHPKPETIETVKEVEKRVDVPGPVQTKTVEVPGPTVEKVPAACLQALDHADNGFTTSSEIMNALLAGDIAGMDAGNKELNALAPKYNTAKAACRAAG